MARRTDTPAEDGPSPGFNGGKRASGGKRANAGRKPSTVRLTAKRLADRDGPAAWARLRKMAQDDKHPEHFRAVALVVAYWRGKPVEHHEQKTEITGPVQIVFGYEPRVARPGE